MKKKLLIILLCVATIMTLAGCGKTSVETTKSESKATVELTDEAKAMIPLFHAMNDYLMEEGNKYDPEDDSQYWRCLARVSAMCGYLYGEPLATLENDNYKITADLMRDFAYGCFATRNQLDTVPLPPDLKDTVYYDYDWDAYFVKAGDAGAVKTIITSFTENKDGTYTAEVDFVDPAANDEVLQHFTYELVDNEIADMSVFPYAVKSISK